VCIGYLRRSTVPQPAHPVGVKRQTADARRIICLASATDGNIHLESATNHLTIIRWTTERIVAYP